MKLTANRTKFIKDQSIESYKKSFLGKMWYFYRIVSLHYNVIPMWHDFKMSYLQEYLLDVDITSMLNSILGKKKKKKRNETQLPLVISYEK